MEPLNNCIQLDNLTDIDISKTAFILMTFEFRVYNFIGEVYGSIYL